MTTTDRMTALDAGFLHLERPGIPIHVGSIATFEAHPLLDARGELRLEELRAEISARLDDLPRLRRRVAWSPLGLARPAWVDDGSFDIANHVDAVHLGGADDDALRRYTADLMVELLPRDRPLWHLRFVTGVTEGRVALIERVHHALVDGVSGVDVAAVLLDLAPHAARHAPSSWTPESSPSPTASLLDALQSRVATTAGAARDAARGLFRPGELVRSGIEIAGALGTVVADGPLAPRSSLNAPIGVSRRLAWVRARLEDVKACGREHGATANDVVLTAVAAGVRELLLRRGEMLADDMALKILVPVSLRTDAARGTLGNQVGALLPRLPVGIADPLARLCAISAATARLKQRREASTSAVLLGAADLLPPRLLGPIARAVHGQRLVNLVVTNVPGSPIPLYASGARMLEAFPVIPLGGNLTVGVAILSYDGALNLGITADVERCPDVDILSDGIERGFAQLGCGGAARRGAA